MGEGLEALSKPRKRRMLGPKVIFPASSDDSVELFVIFPLSLSLILLLRTELKSLRLVLISFSVAPPFSLDNLSLQFALLLVLLAAATAAVVDVERYGRLPSLPLEDAQGLDTLRSVTPPNAEAGSFGLPSPSGPSTPVAPPSEERRRLPTG